MSDLAFYLVCDRISLLFTIIHPGRLASGASPSLPPSHYGGVGIMNVYAVSVFMPVLGVQIQAFILA